VLQGNPQANGNANPVTINANLSSATGVSGLADAINAQTSATGITAIANTTNGTIALTNAAGYDIGVQNLSPANAFSIAGTVTDAVANVAGAVTTTVLAANGAGTSAAVVGGQVSFSGPAGFSISSGAGANSGLLASAAGISAGSSLASIASIDVTSVTGNTPSGANNAISIIDAALLTINNQEANMGAVQNRFTSVISNLNTAGQNLTSARSLIQDTNFASETANLARSQILQQAGTAMLAQANSVPNGVMALLK
jgi:flagellin